MTARARFGLCRRLCGVVCAFAFGLFAASASAQTDTSSVTLTVDFYCAFTWDEVPDEILIEVLDGGQFGAYQGTRGWTILSNTTWHVSFTLGFWSGALPPGSSATAGGLPTTGGPGQHTGTAFVQIEGLTFWVAPMTRTNTLTVEIVCP